MTQRTKQKESPEKLWTNMDVNEYVTQYDLEHEGELYVTQCNLEHEGELYTTRHDQKTHQKAARTALTRPP